MLLRLDDDDHVLVLIFNHIIMDGWSMDIFNRELSAFYDAFSTGGRVKLPELPIQPADFAFWERRFSQSEIAHRHVAYWKKHLEEPRQRPACPAMGRNRSPAISGACASRLSLRGTWRTRCGVWREESCTLSMAFLAALSVLIHESTGEEDILVGCPMAARTRPEVEGLIGCFRKQMAVRTDLSGRPTFRELLGRVRDVATGAYLHLDVPQEIIFPEWASGRSIFMRGLQRLSTSWIARGRT